MNVNEDELRAYLRSKVADIIKEEAEEEKETEEAESNDTESSSTGLEGDTKEFLCKLEGIHIVLKELHWASHKNHEHVLLDEIDGGVLGLLDEVAEVVMGKLGIRFCLGDLKASECDSSDAQGLLSHLGEVIISYKGKVGDGSDCAGLQSVLDDFLSSVDKWKYLSTFGD